MEILAYAMPHQEAHPRALSRLGGRQGPNVVSTPARSPETIGEEVTEYQKHIDALATNLPLLMLLMYGQCRVTSDTRLRFLRANGKPHPDEEGAVLLKVEHLGEVQRLERDVDHAHIANMMLPRSFLVALVSQYDFFLLSPAWPRRQRYNCKGKLVCSMNRYNM